MKRLAYSVPESNRIRVIITTDAKNEADDQFAIAYALMSPRLDVVGIVATHFSEACSMPESPHYGSDSERTMDLSYNEILLVLEKMDLQGQCPVFHGAKHGMSDEETPEESEGARFIIEEAHRQGAPLYVINLGAITDLASAYRMDPSIAQGIEAVIWLGGGKFPDGGSEFNLANDIAGGNVLMDSNLNIWLLPLNSTAPLKMAFSELFYKVRPYGEIGRYLCDQTLSFSNSCPNARGESWIMWDIAAVVLLLDDHTTQYSIQNAPRFREDMSYVKCERIHPIRVYDRVEPRFAFEDFCCKLALCFDRNQGE